MAINKYSIKHWYLMLSGKSVDHAKQGLGKQFRPGELSGYFNDLTNKVLMQPGLLDSEELPSIKTESGTIFQFPVAIFQYGLGAYDCYLLRQEDKYLKKFRQCCDWAVKTNKEDGSWDNFSFVYKDNPYGAMCQGEGISLLLRGYKEFSDERYYRTAQKALNFMLIPVENGGTTRYENGKPCFLEYTHRAAVLNGWIFALFGLYDYTIFLETIGQKNEKLNDLFQAAILLLADKLPRFDYKYWSKYDLEGRISSPFYHDLHIAQMEALSIISDDEIFKEYKIRFEEYRANWFGSKRAFVVKVVQKILEK